MSFIEPRLALSQSAPVSQSAAFQQLNSEWGFTRREINPVPAIESNRTSDPVRYVYRLAWADDKASAENYVGNLLRAIEIQDGVVDAALPQIPQEYVAPARNRIDIEQGLKVMKTLQKFECDHCTTAAEKADFRRAVDRIYQIYELQGAGVNPTSGLPFISTVRKKFLDPEFQQQAIDLQARVQGVLGSFAADKNFKLNTNLFELAMQSTNRDPEKSIELLALLLTRDSRASEYLRFLPIKNAAFARTLSQFPLQVRLTSELDRLASGLKVDRFSFDGIYSTPIRTNYYFWSSAYASNILSHEGYSDATIERVNLNFTRGYQRGMKIKGFLLRKSPAWHDYRKTHAQRTLFTTGRGARFGLENTPCSDAFAKAAGAVAN